MLSTSRTITQGELSAVTGPSCSAIAVLAGDELLTRPDAADLGACVRRGTDLWLAFMRTARVRHPTAAVKSDTLRQLMPIEVITSTVDASTGAPRWQPIVELYGAHTGGGPISAALREHLSAVSGSAPAATGTALPFETATDLSAAIDRIVARADTEQRSLAAAITYNGHTVLFAVVCDGWMTDYHAFDSLRGEWVRSEHATPVSAVITDRWCPRTAGSATAVRAPDARSDEARSPGMFTAIVFVRR